MTGDTIRCPYCGATVAAAAERCESCQSSLVKRKRAIADDSNQSQGRVTEVER